MRTGVVPPEMQGAGPDRSRLPASPGLNRFVWDLRYPGARTLPGRAPGGVTAPLAPPGRYRARLEVDGQTFEEEFDILPDPRLATTPEDYAAEFALLSGIRDRVTAIHDAIARLRDLRDQLDDRLARLDAAYGDTAALRHAIAALAARLDAIEAGLIQPRHHDRAREQEGLNSPLGLDGKLATLGYWVAKSDSAPTRQAQEVFADLSARAARQLGELAGALDGAVDEVNGRLREVGLPPLARAAR